MAHKAAVSRQRYRLSGRRARPPQARKQRMVSPARGGSGRIARALPELYPWLARRVQLRQTRLPAATDCLVERPYALLSGQRETRSGAEYGAEHGSAGI